MCPSLIIQEVLALGKVTRKVHKFIQDVKIHDPIEQVHRFQPGDYVWAKSWKQESLQPKWKGPYMVILTTPLALKVAGLFPWIHHSRAKKGSPRHGVFTVETQEAPLEPPQANKPQGSCGICTGGHWH